MIIHINRRCSNSMHPISLGWNKSNVVQFFLSNFIPNTNIKDMFARVLYEEEDYDSAV